MIKQWVLGSCIMLAAAISQATILVDYDDGLDNGMHDAVYGNGDFEDPESTGSASFLEVAKWENLQVSKQGFELTKYEADGNQTAMLARGRWLAQDLNYTIQADDQFSASFMWKADSNWGGSDKIKMVLFYKTENDPNGLDHVLFELEGTDPAPHFDFSKLKEEHSDAIGKELWVRFDLTAGKKHYVRMDNVYVEVIPEPATLGLVGVFGAMLVWIRRRSRG